MTPDDGPLPPPLPVRVRPAAGETIESYIRRLARANHLRPSLLQVYVRNPGVPAGAIRMRRVAAVSGSTVTALTRALTGLPPTRGQHRAPPPGESRADRKARLSASSAMTPRAACPSGRSPAVTAFTAAWSARHSRRPSGRRPRRRAARPAQITGPIRDVLDELASESRTIWEIWTIAIDEHDSDASYAAIRDYIRTRCLRQAGLLPGGPSRPKTRRSQQRAVLVETEAMMGRIQ